MKVGYFAAVGAFFLAVPMVIFAEQLIWRTSLLQFLGPARMVTATRRTLPLSSSKFMANPAAPTTSQYVVAADARPILLRDYLEHYHSPLAPYANYIFQISQRLGLDYRLLVAIAQQESNLCKKAPTNSYNCWGWGIYGHNVLRFSSYPEAIRIVAEGLKRDYLDKGLTSPEEIMARYTPPSKGSWAFGVRQFMEEITTGRWH